MDDELLKVDQTELKFRLKTFLLHIIFSQDGKPWFCSDIFPHVEHNVSSDHGELYDEGEEIEGAVLNGLTENLNSVAPSIKAAV